MTTTKKTTEQNVTNPFALENVQKEGQSKIEFTSQLIGLSNTRASELMMTVSKKPELHALANQVLDEGDTLKAIELIKSVYDEENILEASKMLSGATEDQLSRLLESRRSDRSKTKSKGLRKSVQNAQTFLSAMYAELVVRQAWNKPYNPVSAEVDFEGLEADQDALNKKIKSLQSKKSRLSKTAEFVPEDAEMLEEVLEEIDRLVSLRVGTPKVSGKTIIKSTDVDTIREALKKLDTSGMDKAEVDKIEAMMKKLG
jgi:hypothetical protein